MTNIREQFSKIGIDVKIEADVLVIRRNEQIIRVNMSDVEDHLLMCLKIYVETQFKKIRLG